MEFVTVRYIDSEDEVTIFKGITLNDRQVLILNASPSIIAVANFSNIIEDTCIIMEPLETLVSSEWYESEEINSETFGKVIQIVEDLLIPHITRQIKRN